MIRIAGIAGSLRRASYNRALLREAAELLPPESTLEILEIGELPLFNEDLEADPPESVRHFKERLFRADALLIATPEYNYSIPGVLKNAIDWASRPATDSPLTGKPVALMGASTGGFGTVRSQMHLRQVFVFTNMLPLNRPEVMISLAPNVFRDGRLQDAGLRDKIRDLLAALAEWTEVLRQGRAAVAKP